MRKLLNAAGIFVCLFAAMLFMRPVQALAGGIWAEIKVQYVVLENDGGWHYCAVPAEEDYIGVTAELTCPDNSVMENTIKSIAMWTAGEDGQNQSIGEHRFFIASEDDVSKMMPGTYKLTDFSCPKGYEYDDAGGDVLYVTLTLQDVNDYIQFAASSGGGEGIEYTILVPVKKTGTVSAALQKPEKAKLSAGIDNIYIETKDYRGRYYTEFQYAEKKNGSYQTLKTEEEQTNVFHFPGSKLKHGKTYYFRARYYKMISGKKMYGDYSDALKVKVAKSQVSGYTPAVSKDKGDGAVSLKVTGSGERSYGYKISYSETKNGKYKEIKETFYTDRVYLNGLDNFRIKAGKAYYFRVRFVETQGKESFYGPYSKAKKIKV